MAAVLSTGSESVAVDLRDVSVSIPVYDAQSRALKTRFIRSSVGAVINLTSGSAAAVEALKGISLTVPNGSRVGLIGGNGAGKTTLLKVISGIYPPTSGHAQVSGRVSALIDLAIGMDPEATGYENISMCSVILGLAKTDASRLVADIERFTELGDYLRLPVRTYSAGMMLRLAFAISTAVEPDILVLDEMISAGDAAFVKKARMRIDNIIEAANVVFLASHDLHLIREICTSVIWMDSGSVVATGPTDEILDRYVAQSS